MFRRGLTSLVLAGMVGLLAVPTVMADTTGGGNSDIYSAFGDTFDGQTEVQVNAFIGTQDGTAVSDLSYSSFAQQDITCKGKGKNKGTSGQIFTQSFGDSQSAVITIDTKLGTASASGSMTVTTDVFNTCTGSDVQNETTTTVSLALTATSATTSTKTRSVTTFPDGSQEVFTDNLATRDAGGTIGGLGSTGTVGFGQIAHEVQTDTLVPPRHH